MPGGTIKRIVRDRGFGFIRDDGGQEWFFHRSSVEGSFDQLNEGQRVSFDEEPSGKGPRATQRPRRRLKARPSVKLLLFDIDGTLVLTGGAGARAMTRAFEDVFGVRRRVRQAFRWPAGPTRGFSPRPRQLIGLRYDEACIRSFRESYLKKLATEVHEPGPRKGIMPGVRALLDQLSAREDVYLALLTGNFEGGARVKLEYFDLWRYFRVRRVRRRAARSQRAAERALERVGASGGPAPALRGHRYRRYTARRGRGQGRGASRSRSRRAATTPQTLQASGADVVLESFSDVTAALTSARRQPSIRRTSPARGPFPRFFGREFDALTFAQQLEHRAAHRAAMEEVLDAAFVADEPESLVDEESCDCPGWHTRSPPSG